MDPIDIEGPLYVEANKIYEEMYCIIKNRRFTAFKKLKSDFHAARTNKSDVAAVEFEIFTNEAECKVVKFGLPDLLKITKSSQLAETPHFFSVTIREQTYMLAASNEEDRNGWVRIIKALVRKKDRRADAWIGTGFMNDSAGKESTNRFGTATAGGLPSNRAGLKLERNSLDFRRSGPSSGGRRSTPGSRKNSVDSDQSPNPASSAGAAGVMDNEDEEKQRDTSFIVPSTTNPLKEKGEEDNQNQAPLVMNDEDEDVEDSQHFYCCQQQEKICGMKVDTIVRMIKVCLAFPFVIVVSSLNFSNNYTILRSVTGIRAMNVLMYVAPVVYVQFVLSQFENAAIQRIAIGFYIFLYLMPVGYVVFSKVIVATSTAKIEDGTFCFKPTRSVRITQANFYAVFGFVMEWLQHILYVLPVGIVTGNKQSRLSDFPPYLPFAVYFWIAVASTFICGLIIILNTVLKGRLHYRFQSSYLIWFFLFNVGSPMFVTIVTILFMSLWCDYSVSPPTLIQDPSLVCYSPEHVVMARAALIAVAIYIIQHTLLPSGTFKETMRDNDLEIMFVPVYLQAHYLLKAIFCGVYVYFYNDNYARVIALTIINMVLLILNNYMKPCSVDWVNLLRDGFFVHATLSGIISINYLGWPENDSTKGMVISTLASTVLFSSVAMYFYYKYTARSTEYSIASAFLDLEWQVSRGGSVHPRVLEPLISLTLSTEKEDWEIAKKYIGQLVWLISYPNMRVQFQSAWGLANLALLDEDARTKIHDAGGTKTLFEWYTEMAFVVQLETLAALANLTLSMDVAEDMVTRNKCIPFFVDLVAGNQMKHSQFAAIALANLARKESFRDMIRRAGGVQALVGCIMSHDYHKRRHGCRALANMALSPSKEIESIFESKGLIDRIIKMALRKEIETQREVIALIRNLSCHARLRPLLLDRGVMTAVEVSKASVFDEVKRWCTEITILLQREVSNGSIDLKALARREGAKGNTIGDTDIDLLKKMEPLQGRVEWSTWGSKLENIFSPIFSTIPTLASSTYNGQIDKPVAIYLPYGISKQDLHRYRDSMSFTVVDRPLHGRLNEYSTAKEELTYLPAPGYIGTDLFTYRLQAGSTVAGPVQVTIIVGDLHDMPENSNPVSAHAASGNNNNTNSITSKKQGRRPSAGNGEDEASDIERGVSTPPRSQRKGSTLSEPGIGGKRSSDIEMASMSPSRSQKSPARPVSRQPTMSSTMPDSNKRSGNRNSE